MNACDNCGEEIPMNSTVTAPRDYPGSEFCCEQCLSDHLERYENAPQVALYF